MTIPGKINLNIAFSIAHAQRNTLCRHSGGMSAHASNTLEILGTKKNGNIAS